MEKTNCARSRPVEQCDMPHDDKWPPSLSLLSIRPPGLNLIRVFTQCTVCLQLFLQIFRIDMLEMRRSCPLCEAMCYTVFSKETSGMPLVVLLIRGCVANPM